MVGIDSLQNGLTTAFGEVSEFVAEHPLGVALGAAGAGAVTGGIVALATTRPKKKAKRKAKKKRRKTSKRKGRKLKFGSKAYRKKYLKKKRSRKKQKQPYTAGKRKDTSHRRIRYTKNNQPYIILASGKARFIKRSSVRRSRKLKGGKY